MKTFFIAGVMQGSRRDNGLQPQDYRRRLKSLIRKYFPGAKIICPLEDNPNSLEYDEATGRRTFLEVVEQAKSARVMIAYLPEASMGTAVEMWEAYRNGVTVWAVSPLKNNWVVKFFSHKIFSGIADLEAYLRQGKD